MYIHILGWCKSGMVNMYIHILGWCKSGMVKYVRLGKCPKNYFSPVQHVPGPLRNQSVQVPQYFRIFCHPNFPKSKHWKGTCTGISERFEGRHMSKHVKTSKNLWFSADLSLLFPLPSGNFSHSELENHPFPWLNPRTQWPCGSSCAVAPWRNWLHRPWRCCGNSASPETRPRRRGW